MLASEEGVRPIRQDVLVQMSLAKKIDHVGIAVDDGAAVHAYCCRELALPVAWEFGAYGAVRSGGVSLGNLNLEIFDAASLGAEGRGLRLVALQPRCPTAELTAALDAVETWRTEPLVVEGETGFTSVIVPPFVTEMTFFCAYRRPVIHSNEPRLAALRAQRGGRLGLHGVSEVRANVDIDNATRILGSARHDRWVFDDGPALVVDGSVPGGSATLVWMVDDDAFDLHPALGDVRLVKVRS